MVLLLCALPRHKVKSTWMFFSPALRFNCTVMLRGLFCTNKTKLALDNFDIFLDWWWAWCCELGSVLPTKLNLVWMNKTMDVWAEQALHLVLVAEGYAGWPSKLFHTDSFIVLQYTLTCNWSVMSCDESWVCPTFQGQWFWFTSWFTKCTCSHRNTHYSTLLP